MSQLQIVLLLKNHSFSLSLSAKINGSSELRLNEILFIHFYKIRVLLSHSKCVPKLYTVVYVKAL